MTININRIELNLTIHATESKEKNMIALANIISPEILKKTSIETEKLEGGYGNPIQFIHIEIKKANEIKDVLKKFIEKISRQDKKKLFYEYEQRFNSEKSRFYLRFDKEQAFKNKLVVNDSPLAIRIEIRLAAYTPEADYKQYLVNKGLILQSSEQA